MTEQRWRMALACYYARITELDVQFGLLLERIEASGQLENTLVVISTDHGRHLGAHGMDGHNFGPFEEIYRIPLVTSGPGVPSGATTDGRVGLHDLCPTLLECVGLAPLDVPDSRSFAPLLRDPSGAAYSFTTGFAENHGTRFTLTQRVCWDGDWKFAFNGFDEDELYDLAGDPWELTNLAQDPAHAERVRQMQRAVWRTIVDTHDKPLVGSQYYALQLGVVGPHAAKESG